MKLSTLTRLLRHPEELQKVLATDVAIPDTGKWIAPWFAALLGFALATGSNAVFAKLLEPPRTAHTASAPRPMVSVQLPPNPVTTEFDSIVKRDLFGAAPGGEPTAEGGTCEPRKSELPLKLTGLIYGGSAESSLVVLESVSSKQADTFLLNDTVDDVAEIIDIEKDQISLQRQGETCPEFLVLEQPPLPTKRVAGKRDTRTPKTVASKSDGDHVEEGFVRKGFKTTTDRRWLNRLLTTEFTKVLHDAKATAFMVGNEVRGFLLTKIRPNSVYEKLGLQDGDVIETINGIELNGITQAINTLNALRNEAKIEVQVRRNGKVENMQVDIQN